MAHLILVKFHKGLSIARLICKQGNQKDLGNYRPIAILFSLSYVMEKFLQKNMNSFCENYALLSNTQYGFRKNRSTTPLLEAFSDHA